MIITGTQHYVVPKRVLLISCLVCLGGFGGALISQHLYTRRVESFLSGKTQTVQLSNKQLEQEQVEYRDLFSKLTRQLSEDGDKGGELSKESVVSFHQLATRLLEGLSSMQDLLEEKEFQLWEKEGLLEYQEERLMNTEDLENEMTAYINTMSATLLARNQTLPEGLADQPYFGFGHASQDMDDKDSESLELKEPIDTLELARSANWSP
ncbi:hypothetical protein M885DRAFT_525772 [Pelagophyceae sp. CCMP2097]|nr:hypothetical protein M885DRAFT_525772 [Pelagophyceae sp. CCMP2097]